jgi:hypothetical protein
VLGKDHRHFALDEGMAKLEAFEGHPGGTAEDRLRFEPVALEAGRAQRRGQDERAALRLDQFLL